MEPRPREGRQGPPRRPPDNHSQHASVVRLGGGECERWSWQCQQGPSAWLVKGLLVEVSEALAARRSSRPLPRSFSEVLRGREPAPSRHGLTDSMRVPRPWLLCPHWPLAMSVGCPPTLRPLRCVCVPALLGAHRTRDLWGSVFPPCPCVHLALLLLWGEALGLGGCQPGMGCWLHT